ncbi:M4 family metallopeptidase [Clostridium sp. UBA1056]|uniref:M4 family metallopeptidase n=1 Tax=unclassified Clostridium TaxID=2614128 RepID=UPI003217F620
MKKRLISILATLALTITFTLNPISVQGLEGPNKSKSDILNEFKELNNGNEKVYMDSNDGMQLFISGILSETVDPSSSSVIDFLNENIALFDMQNIESNFSLISIEEDDLGFTHVKLQQTFDGKEVYGKTITAHFDQYGVITGLTGTLENRITSVTKETDDPITADEAIEIAKGSKTFTELTEEVKAENYIYFDNQTAYEVYRVTLAYDLPEIESWEIFVDAYSGNIIASKSLIREAGPVTGTGTAVNGSTRNLNLYQNATTSYQLKDTTKPMTGTINTYTANYRSTTTGTLMTSPSTTVSDPAAVSAHSYAEVVYDFYKNIFNRNSLDNRGMSINSIVHYGRNYNNAFWNGYKMIYGDGDGSYFTFLSGDLDVVAHEMTHGVTSNSANLAYENQSGALNESMSDVLGVLVQTYDKYNVANGGQWTFNSSDWVVGDEIYTPKVAGDALRSLSNPTLYDQPAHMNNYQNLPNTEDGDWGGVHINSGIPNKAAYLVAQNIGCEKTARIYYRALTVYFNSTTNFSQSRLGLIQAATDLYGTNSTEAQAVSNAFTSVGILGK